MATEHGIPVDEDSDRLKGAVLCPLDIILKSPVGMHFFVDLDRANPLRTDECNLGASSTEHAGFIQEMEALGSCNIVASHNRMYLVAKDQPVYHEDGTPREHPLFAD